MSFHRWDPLRDIVNLRETMNSLIEDNVVRPRVDGVELRDLPLDVQETPDAYLIHAALPGVEPDEVEISVLGETLRLRGEFKDRGPVDDGRWILRERRFGRFDRSLTFPAPVDSNAAQAEFHAGVLTIHLPKAESERPTTIRVKVGAGSQS